MKRSDVKAADESGRTRGALGSIDWVRALEVLAVAAILVAFVLPLCRRSINLSDEGYLLLQSLDMLNGKLLYRDMDAFVSPGIWFVLAGLFSLVEPSVLASRLICLCAWVATVGIAYHIVSVLADRRWGLLCVGLFSVFVVWAFPVWTFTFYSTFAVMLALLALDRLLVWRRDRRVREVFLAGVVFGLAITFKQNYGVFALTGGLLGLAAIRFEHAQDSDGGWAGYGGDLLRLAAGGLMVAVPLLGYFIWNEAFGALFQSLVVHPFVFAGQHSVAYLSPGFLFDANILSDADRLTYGAYSLYNTAIPTEWLKATRLIERLHVLLYQIPVLAFAGAAIFALRPRIRREGQRLDAGLFCVLAVCGMLFLGVFPRADYNHLINLYQPVLIVGTLAAQRLSQSFERPRPLWLRGLGALGAVFVIAYASVAVVWYRAHIVGMNTQLAVPRGGVLLRPERAARLQTLIEIIWKNTEEGDALLTVPDLSMLNFLAERDMPSAYYNQYQHHIAHDGGAAIVRGSEERGVHLALTRYSDFFSDRVRLRDYAPALVDYLDRSFQLQLTAGGDNFLFLGKRPRPQPRVPMNRLLESCELQPPPSEADHQIRPHLLFSTLYQDRGSQHRAKEAIVESRCRVSIPASGGELRFRIDVRPPLAAERGASLTTDVEVQDGAVGELLFSNRQPVFHPYGLQMVREWPPEQRVSLDAFAGREVDLVFRSHRRGWVQSDPFSYKGYATMWLEPRIVPRPGKAQGAH